VNVKIRHADEKDLEEIVRLSKKLGRDESAMDSMISPSPSEFQSPKLDSLRTLKARTQLFLSPKLKEKLWATRLVGSASHGLTRAKEGYICDCFVEKSYRRRGIGKALVKAMLEWFINKGVECVEADVYSSNVPSLKLFKKLGFEEVFKRLRFTVDKCRQQ
jgi:ribosomal protein S18 acetylase RimI-like enzyme